MAESQPTPLPDPLERRAAPRWPVDFPVQYGAGSETFHGRAADMSEGGLCFQGDDNYPAGTVIKLSMVYRTLEGREETIRLEAKICHRRGKTLGVQFLNVTPEQHAAIMETLYQVIAINRR